MRIGLVLPEAPQYSETFFNYKIRGLQESGFEVIVFSSSRDSEKYFFKHFSSPDLKGKNNFLKTFFFLSGTILTFIKAPSKTLKLFSLEKSDGNSFANAMKSVYVNSHIIPVKLDWLHFGFATMSIKRENLAAAIGAKLGVSFRGYDINLYPLKNPGCYDKLWKKIDRVHSISDYLYDKAVDLGLPKETAHEKITPAIDLSLFKMKTDAGEIKNPVRILSVGRLNWIKNYETAISVMKNLKERGIEFIYNIIGEGIELERLKFAVYQAGLDERIFFLGQKKHSEVNNEMHKSDIYLQISFEEGFCVSTLEAQATGLLCVVSDAQGLKENVIDSVTGWVVPKRSPEKIAQKIIDIISMPAERRKEVAMNARKRVESEFGIEEQRIKFKKFFTE